jgi:hypothetical protein
MNYKVLIYRDHMAVWITYDVAVVYRENTGQASADNIIVIASTTAPQTGAVLIFWSSYIALANIDFQI